MLTRRRFSKLATVSALLPGIAPRSALAQSWPDRPVRFIVPFAAGGPTDAIARIVGEGLSKVWNQPVVIENRGGAGGNIAFEAAAKADPDGYTMLMGGLSQAANRSLYRALSYDTLTDFAPVSFICSFSFFMFVPNSLPVTSVKEFIAYAKERPGKLTFSSWGIGSSSHVAMEVLKQERKIDMLHVPFTGAAAAIAAVAGGQIDAMMASLPTSEPQHAGGKVRIIGVTPVKRPPGSAVLPEAGMPPGVAVWVGILAPAKTPPEIVARLNREFKAVLDDPATRAQLTKAGIEPVASVASPQEFSKFFNDSYDFWGRTVRAAKISVELK